MTIIYKEDNMELSVINSIQEYSLAYLGSMVEIMNKRDSRVFLNKTLEQL